MAYFIFLIRTRLYKEYHKIWTNSFGSTKLKLHIFKVAFKIWKKKKKRRTIWTLTGLARPNRSAHDLLPPTRADSRARWLEGQRAGEGEDDGEARHRWVGRRDQEHQRDLHLKPHQ
jgi:hypothetical protein